LSFSFQRDISSFIQDIYVPSSFVVCISFLSFFIDYRSAAARAPLGVTSVLTITGQFEGSFKVLETQKKKKKKTFQLSPIPILLLTFNFINKIN